jgi:hypothetical protein
MLTLLAIIGFVILALLLIEGVATIALAIISLPVLPIIYAWQVRKAQPVTSALIIILFGLLDLILIISAIVYYA